MGATVGQLYLELDIVVVVAALVSWRDFLDRVDNCHGQSAAGCLNIHLQRNRL